MIIKTNDVLCDSLACLGINSKYDMYIIILSLIGR